MKGKKDRRTDIKREKKGVRARSLPDKNVNEREMPEHHAALARWSKLKSIWE